MLSYAVNALSDRSIGAKTITEKNKSEVSPLLLRIKYKSHADHVKQPLATVNEILCNTIWRFMHLRGYINDEHALTPWGEAYRSALKVLDPKDDLEESVFIAIELLRLGLLTSENMFPLCSGAPSAGSGNTQLETHPLDQCAKIFRCG